MDFTQDLVFRGVSLNSISSTLVNGQTVVTGCAVNSIDPSQLEIRQFTEPFALTDGIDVGGTWLGGRHIRITGTVYGSSHADAVSRLLAIANVMVATSGTFGYYALPIPGFGTIQVRPNGLRYNFERREHGGNSAEPLALDWSVTMYAANPAIA